MYLKKIIPVYFSVVLFVSCIDLYTYQDETEKRVIQNYKMSTFTPNTSNSIYLIDPRPVFKNMIYHFDLTSQQWSVTASRNQLPVSDHYDILDIHSANIVKNNKILIFKKIDHYYTRGRIYEYDFDSKQLNPVDIYWPDNFDGNYFSQYDSSFSISQLVYNQFSNQYYYIGDSVLYSLNSNYEFEKKCTVPLGNIAVYFPLFDFISSDTLVTLASEYRGTGSYPEQDPSTIQNKKLVIHKTNINTGKNTIFRHNLIDSLNTTFVYLENLTKGSVITVDYPDQYQADLKTVNLTKINFSANELKHLPPFDPVNISENRNNIINWGDISYHQLNLINCFQKNNCIYLFHNEKGFVLFPGENSWQRLPDPDFFKLNPKQYP